MIVRGATVLAAGAVLLGCFLPPPSGAWLLAAGAALLPVALIALAVGRHRATRRVRLVLLCLLIVLAATLATLIRLHGAGATGTIGLLLQLLGIWFLPLLLTGLGYAATFASLSSHRGAAPEGAQKDAP